MTVLMAKLSTIKLAIFLFFRSVTVLQGTMKLIVTEILGTTRKNTSLGLENSVGFQIHIETRVSLSLVNLSNYSVT